MEYIDTGHIYCKSFSFALMKLASAHSVFLSQLKSHYNRCAEKNKVHFLSGPKSGGKKIFVVKNFAQIEGYEAEVIVTLRETVSQN